MITGVIIVMMLVSTTTYVSASQEKPEQTQTYVEEEKERESGFYREDGFPKDTKDRPAINPDFDPDEDCNISYELKCIPGREQSCFELDGYNNFEVNVCTPKGCPEGYYIMEEDEDGVCYSNSEGCPDYADFVLVKEPRGSMCKYT